MCVEGNGFGVVAYDGEAAELLVSTRRDESVSESKVDTLRSKSGLRLTLADLRSFVCPR